MRIWLLLLLNDELWICIRHRHSLRITCMSESHGNDNFLHIFSLISSSSSSHSLELCDSEQKCKNAKMQNNIALSWLLVLSAACWPRQQSLQQQQVNRREKTLELVHLILCRYLFSLAISLSLPFAVWVVRCGDKHEHEYITQSFVCNFDILWFWTRVIVVMNCSLHIVSHIADANLFQYSCLSTSFNHFLSSHSCAISRVYFDTVRIIRIYLLNWFNKFLLLLFQNDNPTN